MKRKIQFFDNQSTNQVEILRQYGIITEEGCNSIQIEEEKLNKDVLPLLKEWDVMVSRIVEFELIGVGLLHA